MCMQAQAASAWLTVMNDHHQHLLVPILDLRRLKFVTALGRGAKGVVFLVVNEESSESFALKVILRDSIEKKCEERVCFEQQVLMCFEHPLLPRLRGVLTTDKVVGYAIDYCPGRDLHSLRKKQTERMFSDDLIRFYAAEMVLALEYLHNLGIVYRDLKPENVMIQENGHIMLVDFDLSTKLSPKTPRPRASPSTNHNEPESATRRRRRRRRSLFQRCCNSGISPEDYSVCVSESVTKPDTESETESAVKSNSFVGTEEYVAPEIISGNGHDFSVDWWSLGILLHEMLYGATPFKGSNRKETFYRILTKPAQLVGEPTALRDLIRKLLEKNPTKRIGVEGIKGHDFFRGMDWDLVVTISRAPYIPPDMTTMLLMENGSEDREGINEFDVELFVQRIFQSSGNGDGGGEKNKVEDEDDVTNKNNGEKNENKGVWVEGLNRNPCESDNFLVF